MKRNFFHVPGSTQTRQFRPSLLDPWCLPPEVGEVDQLFLGELARSWTSLYERFFLECTFMYVDFTNNLNNPIIAITFWLFSSKE